MNGLSNLWLSLPSPDPVWMRDNRITWKMAAKVGGLRWREGRLLVPAWVDPPSIWRDVDRLVLEDLVAIDPSRPRRCATLRGAAAMLGEAALEEARWFGLPLPVFRDPLAWLQAAGAGVVPLDARRFVNAVLGPPAVVLVAQNVEQGRALDRIIADATRRDRPTVMLRRTAA